MPTNTPAKSAAHRLIGKNYSTPDLVAKVTGKAKYAEDYRAEGMLFARLLLSPLPHARVKRIDTSAARPRRWRRFTFNGSVCRPWWIRSKRWGPAAPMREPKATSGCGLRLRR